MINILSAFHWDDHASHSAKQHFPLRHHLVAQVLLVVVRPKFRSFAAVGPLPDFQVSPDVEGAIGYRAIFLKGVVCGDLVLFADGVSIAYKELFLVVIATLLWGPDNRS